jgi:hypothetical protein
MAGFNIVQELFENRIEISGRFPERGVAQLVQAMTAGFPQVAISDGIEVIEIEDAIRATVHHCERGRTLIRANFRRVSLFGSKADWDPLLSSQSRLPLPEASLNPKARVAQGRKLDPNRCARSRVFRRGR